MGVKEAVVARFREILSQRNMKPNELAYRAGVTPSTVYSMLDGRRREVTINLVKKLCDGLDRGVVPINGKRRRCTGRRKSLIFICKYGLNPVQRVQTVSLQRTN